MTAYPSGDGHPTDLPLPDGRQIIARLGGMGALVDGAVPAVVFVVTHALVRSSSPGHRGIWISAAAALLTALGLLAWRRVRGRSPQGAFRGIGVLAATVGLAAATGEARNAFLPGIVVDALYALGLFVSVLVRRPAIGYLYGFLFDRSHSWRDHVPLRRVLAVASVGWAAVYTVRYVATVLLYRADEAELLAVTKLVLGWPVTALGAILTIAAVRSAASVAGR